MELVKLPVYINQKSSNSRQKGARIHVNELTKVNVARFIFEILFENRFVIYQKVQVLSTPKELGLIQADTDQVCVKVVRFILPALFQRKFV